MPMRRNKFIVISILIALIYSCDQDKVRNIAVITGGHSYDSVNFVKMFQAYPDLLFDHLVHPDANGIYSSDSLEKYDALVFYDLYQDITDDQKKAFIDMLNKGKGLVFLHHSIASYQDWDEFMSILGARYYLEPGVYNGDSVPASTYLDDQEVDVSIIAEKHPVTKDIENFKIHEEVYDLYEVIPSVEPLLGTDHPESGDLLGWTNTYGKSRIVYLQFGHDNNAYSNQNFRQLLRQSIDWVSR